MPEVIYCPSGGHKLRVAEEMLGQVVQCPICGLVFTAPTRSPAAVFGEPQVRLPQRGPWIEPEKRTADAHAVLKTPAAILLIVSVFGLLYCLAQTVFFATNPEASQKERMQIRALSGFDLTARHLALIELAFALLNAFVCIAAIQMLRLRTFGWSITGCILALFAFGSPCCLFSFPLGIWTLTVLNRPDVREAFR